MERIEKLGNSKIQNIPYSYSLYRVNSVKKFLKVKLYEEICRMIIEENHKIWQNIGYISTA